MAELNEIEATAELEALEAWDETGPELCSIFVYVLLRTTDD